MNRPSRKKLQSRTNTFSDETIDLLFSHIMANDVVAHDSALPDRVPVIFSDQDIHSAYCLARELFIRRLDIELLYTLVLNIAVTGDLEVVEQRAFKDARAILTGCLLMPPLSCMIQRELNNFQTL
ncbi:hypothetical protein [Acetobacter syzygii]|uniref:hypothetical protein n=1 Tax=Acetobacter syzygii TaxID=146476 RepID=UPI0039EA43FB